VDAHLRSIYDKLGVSSRVELALYAVAREDFPVEQSFHARSGGVSPTVDPDHNGDGRG
jgi:hypothetical protein